MKTKRHGKSHLAAKHPVEPPKRTITFALENTHQVAALSTMADIIGTNGWTLVEPEPLLWALMDLEAGIGDGKMISALVDDAEVAIWRDIAKYCRDIAAHIDKQLQDT